MNLDWLQMYQDYAQDLPQIGEYTNILYDTVNDKIKGYNQPSFKKEGSYSTSVQIRISGARITVSGNPSKFSRMDNLIGFDSIESAVQVYNKILLSLGLPPFTKCTFVNHREINGKIHEITDGATITRIDINSNYSVGEGNTYAFIKGISNLRYRNSIPRLHTNGASADWLTPRGKGGRLIYPKVYDKANELELFTLPKIKKEFGEKSEEVNYLLKLIQEAKKSGIVRFEQEFKSQFLRQNSLNHYGMVELSDFHSEHEDFVNLPNKLVVEKMDTQTISEHLLSEGICKGTYAANTTAQYAQNWMNGKEYREFKNKSSVQKHRARLRRIGIDIFDVFDVSRHSPIIVREAKVIVMKSYSAPDWYRQPNLNALQLKAVA